MVNKTTDRPARERIPLRGIASPPSLWTADRASILTCLHELNQSVAVTDYVATRSGSTLVTRNQVCIEPGMLQHCRWVAA